MGQKLNPIIFRLGINKIWKTEFFEKKNNELPLYVFKDLEIKNYIKRFFETNYIIVHDYKQHYSASTLNLYISYFVTPDFILSTKPPCGQLIIQNGNENRLNITKKVKTSPFFYHKFSSNKNNNLLFENSFKAYTIRQYLNFNLSTNYFFKDLQNIQINRQLHPSNDIKKTYIKGFFEQIFAVLSLFVSNHLNIAINFCCVNKNVQFYKSTQTPFFISFQKFKNIPFFKEGIELLFHVVYNVNSANLLAKFIAFQLKKVKRHKFFLSFLKQILGFLLMSNLAKIKGVKIIVKGRLNGLPRAKHKILVIGDVPVQTISLKLDYFQTTTHNANGSYGIKVWIVEK
jgi:ribosomal protein S3